MAHQKIKLDIKGMHCRSCEIILEKDISKIVGVKKVQANFRKKTVEIFCDSNKLNLKEIEKAVEKAGYHVGKEDKKSFFSKDAQDYLELAAAGSMLLAAYFLLRDFGILDFSSKISSAPGLAGVFLVGLTAGISSCMALIGGLVLGISARHAELHPEATPLEKFRLHLFFNLGRLVFYALFGGLIGLLGSVFTLFSGVLGILIMILGTVMLFLGLKLVEIFPRMSSGGIVLPKRIGRMFGLARETEEYNHKGSFVTGALTFFVPCGFTQAMQLYAVSTGSFTQGALIMLLFALGTMPGIIGIGGLTSVIKGAFSRYFFKFAGLVVIILAFFNIRNGFNLAGLSISLPNFSYGAEESGNSNFAPIENGKQIIEMEQWAGGYKPNKFTVKKGIPVLWKINSTTSQTCASYIVAPSLGIRGSLKPGENLVEFTPDKVGQIRFSCSMGMYTGVINVVIKKFQ